MLSFGSPSCEHTGLEPQWHKACSHIQICANDQPAGQPTQIMYMLRVLTRSVSNNRTLPPMPALGVDGCARAPLLFKHQVGANPLATSSYQMETRALRTHCKMRVHAFNQKHAQQNSLTATRTLVRSITHTQVRNAQASCHLVEILKKCCRFPLSCCQNLHQCAAASTHILLRRANAKCASLQDGCCKGSRPQHVPCGGHAFRIRRNWELAICQGSA
jgi:hypothetical protein